MSAFRIIDSIIHWQVVFALTICLTSSINVNGQLGYLGRYEKEFKSSDYGYTIVSLHEDGIALIREKNKFKDSKKLWEITLLDTLLKKQWESDIEIKSSFNMVGYEYAENKVYFLFREGERDFNKFNLVQLNVQDHSIQYYEVSQEFSFQLTHFSVVGENAILGGYVLREPAVMLYETASQSLKVIPGFFLKDTELLDIQVNHNSTFNTLLIERNSLDKKHLVMKTFDKKGALLLEDRIEIERSKHILTGISSTLNREELAIMGTYSGAATSAAVGYYAVLVDPFTEQSINYVPFATIPHLLDYLPEKRASRIKAKAKTQIDAGRNPDYKAYMLPVRIEEENEGFYFLSEMYDPSSSNSRPYWNNYNNPYYTPGYSPYNFNSSMNRYATTPYSYNNFNQNSSAKMIESVLTLFDARGNLIWSNALIYENEKRYSAEQTSDFVVSNELIRSIYKKESQLYISTGSLDENPEYDTLNIPLKNLSDVIRNEKDEDTGIRHWYQNKVYVWGYQSLKDTEKMDEDQTRYVFYLSKFEAN